MSELPRAAVGRATNPDHQRNFEMCEYFHKTLTFPFDFVMSTELHSTTPLYAFDACVTRKNSDVIIRAIEGKALVNTDISRGLPIKEAKVNLWREFRHYGCDDPMSPFAWQYTKDFQFFYVIRTEFNKCLYSIEVTEDLLNDRTPEELSSRGRPDPEGHRTSFIIEYSRWQKWGLVELPSDGKV